MTADDFLESLRQDFLYEAGEYLEQMQEVLLRLEEALPSEQQDAEVEIIYRTTHSLKGAARSVNLPLIEQLCISLEEVWKNIRNKTLRINPDMFDVFNDAVDLLRQLLDDMRVGSNMVGPYEVEALRKKVEALHQPKTPGLSLLNEETNFAAPVPELTEFQPEAVSITEIAPDLAGAAPSQGAVPAPPPDKASKSARKALGETIRVPVAKLEYLLSEVEELMALHNRLKYFERQSEDIATAFKNLQQQLASREGAPDEVRAIFLQINLLARQLAQYGHEGLQHKTSLLLQLQQLLMFPMAEVFDVLPRMVRDIAQSKQKKVNLVIEGSETGVDRRIIEGIKDPLIHLVRNSIDHGIEAPELRIAAGKPAYGQLKVTACINGEGKLQLIIADDGAGIKTQKLREKAVAMNLLSADQASAMDETEALKLIFASGLTTSTQVSDISGHGLGMSIVAEKIESLSGNIDLDSVSGKGTTITITLPRVLTLFRGILVREHNYNLLIPIQVVVKAMRLHRSKVRQLGALPVIDFMHDSIPLIRLSQILNLPHKHTLSDKSDYFNLLIIRSGTRTVALQLGTVVGEESGVVRPFEPAMGQSEYFAGALILSSGQIAFVLRTDVLTDREASPAALPESASPKHLLVVEDSLTIRNLLRNMLETAGYRVTTANDGQDACQKLEKDSFDAVVSDMEMPRMNGFELTKKIRSHERWKFLPIVLVTSLESDDDKRKGMEAGASAYVTKRDFEKGSLLQILDNLLV